MRKDKRLEIKAKFDGKCAYCGNELTDVWQVDHLIPKLTFELSKSTEDPNHIDNLMPACVICNHYKRSLSLESFRYALGKLHKHWCFTRKCKVPVQVKRQRYMMAIAVTYRIRPDQPFNRIFYFEKIQNEQIN
jgi:hypothetical protein